MNKENLYSVDRAYCFKKDSNKNNVSCKEAIVKTNRTCNIFNQICARILYIKYLNQYWNDPDDSMSTAGK